MGQLYFKKHWEIARHVYNFTGAWDLYSVINFLYTAYKRIEPGKAILLKLHKKLKKKEIWKEQTWNSKYKVFQGYSKNKLYA